MNVKLIAMDLDGTALLDDHKTVSPRLAYDLDMAHKKGVNIVPVTGRPYHLLPPLFKQNLPWKEYGIFCNGSQIRNLRTGELLHSLTLQGEDLQAVLEVAQRYQVAVEFSVGGKLYLTQGDLTAQQARCELAFHCQEVLPQIGVVVESLWPMCTDSHIFVEKVNVNGVLEERKEELEKDLAALEVSSVWSSSCCMEVTHRHATKGRALHTLCRILGIPLKQVLALGDSGNDLSMLQEAGIGVAMGNAPEFVKQAADAVTNTNTEDGAAIAIEQFAL